MAGRYRQRRQHKTLVHEVWPEFEWAEPAGAAHSHDDGTRSEKRQRDGGKILTHETVLLTWEVGEMCSFLGNDGALDVTVPSVKRVEFHLLLKHNVMPGLFRNRAVPRANSSSYPSIHLHRLSTLHQFSIDSPARRPSMPQGGKKPSQ